MLRVKGGLQKLFTLHQNRKLLSTTNSQRILLSQSPKAFFFSNTNNQSSNKSGSSYQSSYQTKSHDSPKIFQSKTRTSGGNRTYDNTREGGYQPRQNRDRDRSSHDHSGFNKGFQKRDVDEQFREKFGKTKSELLDTWLEMDGKQLIEECKSAGLTPTDKHIENIQNLFEYLKKFESELEQSDSGHQHQSERRSHQSSSYQERIDRQTTQTSFEQRKDNQQNQQTQQPQSATISDQLFKRKPSISSGQSAYEKREIAAEKNQQEVEKAKDALNEQLSRILKKRRKKLVSDEGEWQKLDFSELHEEKKDLHEQAAKPLYQEIENAQQVPLYAPKYVFDFGTLKSAARERGAYDQSNSPKQVINQASPELVDKIFEMAPQDLTKQFERMTQNSDSVINQMDLKQSDFEQLPSIAKKKILISLNNLAIGLDQNPNQTFLDVKSSSHLPNYISFIHQNLALFNSQSKATINQHMNQILEDCPNDNRLSKNPQFLNQAIEISQELNIQLGDLRKRLTKVYFDANETIYNEAQLEHVTQFGKVVQFLSQGDNKQEIHKIQNAYYGGIRKLMNKKNIKVLPFNDKMDILRALPPVEGDAYSSAKSLHHIILNDLMSNQNIPKWQTIDKSEVMTVIDKAMEMHKSRDLNIKLRGCLSQIRTHQFNLEDIFYMLKKLSEGKRGHIDAKIVSQVIKRNVKTSANLANALQAKKHFEFFEFIYKNSPLTFTYLSQEFKTLLYRSMQLGQQQHLSLNEMIKFSKIMIPSLYKPNLFFSDMITTTRYNFKNDADKQELYELVTQIHKRAHDGLYNFEHLQLSTSRVHRNFKPFTEKTIFLIQRIIGDIINCESQKLSSEELIVINSILSFKPTVLYLFKSQDEINKIITSIEQNLPNLISEKIAALNGLAHEGQSDASVHKKKSEHKEDFHINYQEWREQFQALTNLAQLSKSDKENNMLSRLQSFEQPLYDLLKLELFKSTNLSLDELYKLNQSVLGLIDLSDNFKKIYETSLLNELMQASLESYFLMKKPFVLSFEKFKKNIKISKLIQQETNKALIQDNLGAVLSYLNHSNLPQGKEIAQKLMKEKELNIQGVSRNLVNEDIVSLFKVIDKYSLTEDAIQVIMNVAPNLMTIEAGQVYMKHANQDVQDQKLIEVNEKLNEMDLTAKRQILRKFLDVHTHHPDVLRTSDANLGPLSSIMADVFETYTDEDVLVKFNFYNIIQTCLKVLGNDKVENYHESFIKKLFEMYSQPQIIDNMANQNQKFFFKFAKNWPRKFIIILNFFPLDFLKNSAILNQLINIKHSTSLAKQQSETIHILTKKNVLHPELLDIHFDTFMKMKDKDRVTEYLTEFLHTCATLGYANFDMSKLTQVFRRIYKTPDQVNMTLLLDYYVVLALSNAYYRDFDPKSVEFVEAGIGFIEQKFTGQEILETQIKDPVTGETETMKLSYFKSIPSQNKLYNKVLLRPSSHVNTLKFPQAWESLIKHFDHPIEDEIGIEEEQEPIIISSEKHRRQQRDEIEEDEKKPNPREILEQFMSKVDKSEQVDESKEMKEMFDQILDNEPEDDFVKPFNGGDNQTLPYSDDEAMMKENPSEINDDATPSDHKKKERKIYERKARESLYSEELEFHQFRKKKLQDLDKKSKHLLLFSNINQLNFVDINQSELAKAWSVLFHFRSKTFDSIIYDEFESITMRNTIGKSKGHELFSKFYLKLIENSYDKGFRIQLTTKCEKTGWPIDISLNQIDKNQKKLALYFFLQEEVCLNAKEQSEEPLGLQKLMLKHLQNISDYKIEFVTENDFYMNKDSLEGYMQYLVSEKMQI